MKILVTGADGFIGKNLTVRLKELDDFEVLAYDMDTDPALLDRYAGQCDFVCHLAGVNRPEDPDDFMRGNFGFTSELLDALRRQGSRAPVLLASSIQAALDNPYGKSKRAGEELLFRYGEEQGVRVLVYRFPNVFGKWCRPHYNSVVATFCHQIARGLPIRVDRPDTVLRLVHIDDVAQELLRAFGGNETRDGRFCRVPEVYTVTLERLAALLRGFREQRSTLGLPDCADPFEKKLYSTYLSYLPQDGLGYPLKPNTDGRGSFTEFIRTPNRGQVSVNVTRPGVTRGNHWHHTKTEKFLVVSGSALIRLRRVNGGEIAEYAVSGDRPQVVDIPPGFTHSIQNTGKTDLVTVMWANEPFDPQNPDTYYQKV